MTQADPHTEVYVVIPAYGEETAIGSVVDGLADYIDRRRVIVVDDGSPDATSAAARKAGATVLRHPINRGQGAALGTGIALALELGARAIVTFDADGQHDPADLPAMVEPILAGEADVVLGSRFLEKSAAAAVPTGRRIMLRLAVIFTMLVSRIRVTDTHNGLRALSPAAAAKIRIRQDGMAHASEILDEIGLHGLRYVERPVHIRYSEYSMAKGQRNRDAIKMALRVLMLKVTR